MPIVLRIMAACVFMAIVTAGLGLYALRAEDKLGDAALRMYDNGFMSVSYAASARAKFEQARAMFQQYANARAAAARQSVVQAPSERQRLLAVARGQPAGQPVQAEQPAPVRNDVIGNVLDDLDVGIARAMSVSTRDAAQGLREQLAAIETSGLQDATVQTKLDAISAGFENLMEGFAQDGYVSREETEAILAKNRQWTEIAFAASIMLALAATLLLTRSVVPALRLAARIADAVAAGHLDNRIPVPRRIRRSETARLLHALADMQARLLDSNRQAAARAIEKAADQAARDRRQATMERYTAAFDSSVSGVLASLVHSAGEMRVVASSMSEAALRTRGSASSAVEGVTASVRDLNAVAVAAEQMTASIQEISRQVVHVTEAVRLAIKHATSADAKVAGLAEAANHIGDVVQLITDVAGRTNLLALNATIEAARAGDSGKGFAVVAGEVKALAAQTAKATEQISAQIVAIRDATEQAVGTVREVSAAIGRVGSVAGAIASAVEEQAAVTQEISGNVQHVSVATSAATKAMERVLAMAEQADTGSRLVLTTADGVAGTSETLGVEVRDFLDAMTRQDVPEGRVGERSLIAA